LDPRTLIAGAALFTAEIAAQPRHT